MDLNKNIYYIKANENCEDGENPTKLDLLENPSKLDLLEGKCESESEEEQERQDLNDITKFSDMKLHVKQLQEDLWDFISAVRKFNAKLELKEKETICIVDEIVRNNRNIKIGFGFGVLLLILIVKKK